MINFAVVQYCVSLVVFNNRKCLVGCFSNFSFIYTLWISRCIATAKERIPGSIDNDVTGMSECSQQRGNLKDNGYITPDVP
ncbi:hypothetical protein SAMN02982990_02513 [Photorhabdus luminescens]|uniref:Uncharacterized protein n=1 Tax=Photorhabdus luminescens TaxID=29488 RepID=A0A1G5QWU9_PHOLU|nr:hypothetical protein SAMN02982990_02513 [Photorhabdus luminescens]